MQWSWGEGDHGKLEEMNQCFVFITKTNMEKKLAAR